MSSFEEFSKRKLPDKKCLYRSLKDGITCYNEENLDGHITDEEYLACKKIWNKFNVKNMGDYHDHYLKKSYVIS